MMNEYTTAIEQLDQKVGRPITIEDWKRIAAKSDATLTADDILVCGFFGGETSAAAARSRRAKALAPELPPDPPALPATTTATPSDPEDDPGLRR